MVRGRLPGVDRYPSCEYSDLIIALLLNYERLGVDAGRGKGAGGERWKRHHALEGLHIGVRADPETWRSLDSRGNVNDGVALSLKITNRGTRVSHLIE